MYKVILCDGRNFISETARYRIYKFNPGNCIQAAGFQPPNQCGGHHKPLVAAGVQKWVNKQNEYRSSQVPY